LVKFNSYLLSTELPKVMRGIKFWRLHCPEWIRVFLKIPLSYQNK